MGQSVSGKKGGLLKGKKHSECDDDGCGIKAVVDGTKTVELQGGEVIINAEAMTDPEVMTVTGTKKEIASKINSDKGYGVKFEEGGEVKPSFKTGGVLPNRIYLGEEGGSEISGKSVFEKAVQLEKQGKSNEQIRQLTGWFRNPHDKLWRFEISDKEFVLNNSEIERIKARIKSTGKPEKFTFEDIARHDILFTAYPEAKKLSVIFENDKSKPQSSFSNNTITYNFNYELEKEHTTTGSSDNGKDRVFRSAILRERRSAFAHELTHYVQIREGHGRGSSSVWEFGKLLKEQQSLGREVGESEKADLVLKSNTLYWSSSGEIEARDVQRRIEMTDEELRKNEPLKTIDRSGEPTVRIGKKMKSGGEVSDEMENFDWNSLYEGVNDNDTEKESSKQPKYDIEKIKSLIDQKIDDEKAIIEDWSSRDYKSNKGIVYTGGDDIHGTPLQIGSINESRRRNKINSAERVISELSLAKDIVEKYRGNESDLYNIVLDDYRKNYYRGYKPSSHKRDYKAEQRYSDAYDLLINTVKESETFKSGGEVNKETKMDNQLSKGTKVELEHKDTIEEISSGKLSPEEGAKEIAKDHIAEDPAYYDKLEKVEGKKEDTIIAYTDAKENYDGFGTKTIEVTPYKTHRGDNVRKVELPVTNQAWQSARYLSGNRSFMLENDFNTHKDNIFTKDEPKKEFYELTYPEFAKSISLYPNQIDKTLDVSYQNEDGSSTMLPLRINGVNENVANEYNRLQLEKFHLREVKKAIADGIIVPKKVIDFYKSLDSLLQERYGVYFNEEKETEMNIEESEENVMLPYKNYKGQINPKSIVIKPQDGTKGRVFRSWHQANDALRYIIDQQKYSDAIYEVEFQDGETLDGTIDLEPKSFWDGKNNPLTWHLNTFWGNVSKASASPIMSQEGIDFAKKLVSDYNIGQNIPNSNIETEIEPEMPAETSISPERMKILESVMKSMSKEKKTAYNYVYDRLMKVAPDLMSLLEQAEYPSDVYGKSQYRTDDFGGNDAFMYLAIEGLEKDSAGRYVLSISHYYKQQGDMMCDPCMTVRLDTELKTVEALTFKMDGIIGRGIIKEVYGLTKDGKEGVNLSEKKSQNSFLNTWSSNWVKQGHKVEFRPLPEKEASGTPISEEAQAIIQPEWDKMQDFLAGKEAKALERKSENEIKREKYPVVVEWSEGSSDENIGFENLEQLEIWLDQIGFTDDPDNTYIKNRVWFRGMTSYVRIDLSKQKGDFNPKEQSLIEYLIENVSKQFDWQSLSEGKTPIVQDANFTYFKGIEANYDNQFKLNKAIEEFLDSKTDDYVYATEEKEFISTYEGYGGLEKQGATGVGLLFEYYTPPKLIEKMWGLAYKYGFSTGKVLEPSVGIGRFLNYTSKNDTVKAYEISQYSAKICRIIHPKADVIQSSFAEHFYKGNVFNPKFEKDFDLVIGNPPYGKMTDLRTYGENSRIGASISQYEHYFILRGLDCLKSGGLLIYVSTANLATKGYEKIKEKIIEKADLVDCYLLPNTTFKQTKVNTSLIVLRRK